MYLRPHRRTRGNRRDPSIKTTLDHLQSLYRALREMRPLGGGPVGHGGSSDPLARPRAARLGRREDGSSQSVP